jgi:pyruvate dehydrogenase E2 component (dihydrolipoamide acetyltransferase)
LPECAILGVGRIKRQPVMIEDQVVGRQMVWLSLTFDHRLVDGGPAARFLQRVVQLVESPHLLIT